MTTRVPTVINRYHKLPTRPGVPRIYIGRPSPLGNPFVIGQHGDRASCIEQYRHWLWQRLKDADQAVLGELRRINTLLVTTDFELECYCVPADCHGRVIRDALAWLASRASGGATEASQEPTQ